MNIAHVVPYSVKFPLKVHNGRYDWVLQLATLQAERGHTVTIYCNPESVVDTVHTTGISRATDNKELNNLETFRVALRNNHDIYHSHFDDLHYRVAHETTKQIVFTQHWWPKDSVIEFAASQPKNIWAVPPTRFMYDFDIQAGIATKGFIYHGIDLKLFHVHHAQKNGRLLFVGRISPEKNIETALAVAKKSGIGLDIIGKIAEKNLSYWDTLQPYIDGTHIRYLGQKSPHELVEYYASAQAVIFPSGTKEAFGLVAVESQACGTPVIMRRGGSRGELVEEGKTGFLCETDNDFIEAARKASTLQASDCFTFAKRFDIQVMAEKYDTLYQDLVSR